MVEDIVDLVLRWAIPALCVGVTGWMARQRQSDKALRLGVQALLRDRLYWAHDHYNVRGELPIYARENVSNMYAQYHALGGNGAMTELVRELESLPTSKKAAP